MSEHFTNEELQCKCCGALVLHENFLKELELLRNTYGKPMRVNCCYRCEKHNAEVGGAPNSYHKKGMAIDIHCPSAQERHTLALIAMQLGWSIVVYKTFLHLDRRIDVGLSPILTCS